MIPPTGAKGTANAAILGHCESEGCDCVRTRARTGAYLSDSRPRASRVDPAPLLILLEPSISLRLCGRTPSPELRSPNTAMKRIPLYLTMSLGLVLPACANNSGQGTQNPDATAGQDGGAEAPDRARGSTTTASRGPRGGGRIKSFDAPKEPRPVEVTVVEVAPIPGPLTVGEARPSMAPVGSVVEIMGSGFGTDASKITVKSGGTAWEVAEVHGDRIVALVPNGATSGAVEVSMGGSKGTASNNFTLLGGDSVFESSTRDLHGLVGTVYALGSESQDMPDFGSLGAPVGTIGITNFALSGPASDFEQGLTNYAISFRGALNVDGEGEYNLCLNSDDGSRLLLMDTLVIDNAGVHEANESCELVYLEAGEYDIEVQYTNAASTPNATLELSWAKDGGGKTTIPSSTLFRP